MQSAVFPLKGDIMTNAENYYHSLLTFGIMPGLDRIKILLERLGSPEKSLRCIHVAGTNGKGTVCSFLASVLKEAGYKTGLYTSPYIVDFRERIRVNGKAISEEDGTILRMLLDGMTQKEIAEKLGYKNHSGVNKRIKKMREKYMEFDPDFKYWERKKTLE